MLGFSSHLGHLNPLTHAVMNVLSILEFEKRQTFFFRIWFQHVLRSLVLFYPSCVTRSRWIDYKSNSSLCMMCQNKRSHEIVTHQVRTKYWKKMFGCLALYLEFLPNMDFIKKKKKLKIKKLKLNFWT